MAFYYRSILNLKSVYLGAMEMELSRCSSHVYNAGLLSRPVDRISVYSIFVFFFSTLI